MRPANIVIAAGILFALNTSSNAQLKGDNDDARLAAARRACVAHQETILADELIRNCQHLARSSAFESIQYQAWQRCAASGLMGSVDSENRLVWLRANQQGKNMLCLSSVEQAKKFGDSPNSLMIYKP